MVWHPGPDYDSLYGLLADSNTIYQLCTAQSTITKLYLVPLEATTVGTVKKHITVQLPVLDLPFPADWSSYILFLLLPDL